MDRHALPGGHVRRRQHGHLPGLQCGLLLGWVGDGLPAVHGRLFVHLDDADGVCGGLVLGCVGDGLHAVHGRLFVHLDGADRVCRRHFFGSFGHGVHDVHERQLLSTRSAHRDPVSGRFVWILHRTQ